MRRVTLDDVELTDRDIARIPRGNLRVPLGEFVQVWAEAERQVSPGAWHAAGVAMTCRWMAAATVRPPEGGSWYPARAPITSRTIRAYEELIEAEFLAAEKLAMRQPRPEWVAARPGWIEAVCATLRWAWRHSGPAPLALAEPAS